MKRINDIIRKTIFGAFIIGFAYIFLYPFLYMIVNSVKTNDDLYSSVVVWIPRSLHFSNYKMASQILSYANNLKNTVIVTVFSLLGQLVTCSMAGYGLARCRFVGKKAITFLMLLAMLIPAQTIIVPQYLIFSELGWINTYLPFIIPSWLGNGFKGALFIFVFRQFYSSLPRELEEAARVDGCGFFRTFFSIIFPISKSSYVVVTVLGMVWHWSNYFEPSIYISKTELSLLSSGLANLAEAVSRPPDVLEKLYDISSENVLNNAVLMAACFMVLIPILIVFAFLQRQFIEGIEHTGLTAE